MEKKIIYIAHPISGNVQENIKSVLAIVRELSIENQVIPFAPYIVDVQSLDDANPSERAIGFEHNKAIFQSGIIDEVWLYGGRISNGMQTEIEWAKELNIKTVQKWQTT